MSSGLKCVSCKKDLINDNGTVRFQCPGCGKVEILRCRHCREIAAKYVCSNCGFSGPN